MNLANLKTGSGSVILALKLILHGRELRAILAELNSEESVKNQNTAMSGYKKLRGDIRRFRLKSGDLGLETSKVADVRVHFFVW